MTEEEIQAIIDKSIRRHEIRVAQISGAIGLSLLFFYTHGVITLVRG
jgi:hypothetical protein